MTQNVSTKSKNTLGWLALIAICLVGGWLRWQYIRTDAYHVDEFISMLAIRMILEKGQPILPSGMFYDNGLIHLYLGAAVALLDQNNLLIVRWLSLAWGVLTIFLVYLTAWQLFGSRGWALVGAAFIAFYPDAIEWGGRVRMYAQANIILLLWLLLAWWGTLGGSPRRWARWLLIFSLWIGLNTHFVLILLLPPLSLSLLLVLWLTTYQRTASAPASSNPLSRILTQIDRPRRVFVEVTVAAIVLGLTVWLASSSFMARFASETPSLEAETLITDDAVATAVLDLSFEGDRWGELFSYLTHDNVIALTILALPGLIFLCLRLIRRTLAGEDLAGLFIAGLLGGTLLELAILINSEWAKTRYNYLLLLLPLLLLALYSLRAMTRLAAGYTSNRSPTLKYAALAGLGLVGLVWPLFSFWPDTMEVISGATSSANRYNFAFDSVDQMRQPGDQLLTVRPAAAYLYANKLDYYANQGSEVIMPSPQGWVDRYTGVPYLPDVSALNEALDKPGDLWFVIDDTRLFENLTPPFTQQVLHRMEQVDAINNVLILREAGDSWPISETPAVQNPVTLENGLKFIGYSVTPASASPGQMIHLTTFWQGGDPLLDYKVFVHLRDANQNNVAQADFFPFSQLDPDLTEELIDQAERDTIRIAAALPLPPDLSAGEYALWTGLYSPETLERLNIVDDPSYSNEIPLGMITIRPSG